MTVRLTATQLLTLLPVQQITANTNGAGVAVARFSEASKFILFAEHVAGGAATLDVAIEDAAVIGGPYDPTGLAFTQVEQADAEEALNQYIDEFRQFIRAALTIAGASADYRVGCGVLVRPQQ